MNDEQLASDIRRAFGRYRMKPAPIETAAPVARDRRRLFGGLSFAGIAAAVALALAFTFGLAPGSNRPPSVWAAWQPTPTKPDETVRAAATDKCTEVLGIAPSARVPGSSLSYANLRLVAQDQRGPAALFIFALDETYFACLVSPNAYGSYDAFGFSSAQAPHDHRGHVEGAVEGGAIAAGPELTAGAGDPGLVVIMGWTDAETVMVERQNGVPVQATVDDGVFAAWWIGGGGATDLVAYDANGQMMQRVQAFPTRPPG